MESYQKWVVQARKGLVEWYVLNALSQREHYGYELTKRVVQTRGLQIPEGTVYPLLSRLRLQGLVKTRLEESKEGAARKYYSLTPSGQNALELMNSFMEQVMDDYERITNSGGSS